MRGMRRALSGVGVGVALGVVVAGVLAFSLPPSGRPRSSAAPGAPGPACRHGQLRGYALTGAVYEAVLRPIDLCPATLGAPILTGAPVERMSWLTGTGDRAVVAEYGGGADRIALVTPEGLVVVPGLGPVIGHSPSLAADGRLTYTDKQPDGRGGFTFTVRLFDPGTGRQTTLLRSAAPPSGTAWGPGGRLALVVDAGGIDAHLLLWDRPGAKPRRLTDLPREASTVLWAAPADLIVVVGGGAPEQARAVVVDAGTGRTRFDLDPAWRPLGVTRDGALIAVRAGGEVARLAGPGFDRPEVYGVLPAGQTIWQVAV